VHTARYTTNIPARRNRYTHSGKHAKKNTNCAFYILSTQCYCSLCCGREKLSCQCCLPSKQHTLSQYNKECSVCPNHEGLQIRGATQQPTLPSPQCEAVFTARTGSRRTLRSKRSLIAVNCNTPQCTTLIHALCEPFAASVVICCVAVA